MDAGGAAGAGAGGVIFVLLVRHHGDIFGQRKALGQRRIRDHGDFRFLYRCRGIDDLAIYSKGFAAAQQRGDVAVKLVILLKNAVIIRGNAIRRVRAGGNGAARINGAVIHIGNQTADEVGSLDVGVILAGKRRAALTVLHGTHQRHILQMKLIVCVLVNEVVGIGRGGRHRAALDGDFCRVHLKMDRLGGRQGKARQIQRVLALQRDRALTRRALQRGIFQQGDLAVLPRKVQVIIVVAQRGIYRVIVVAHRAALGRDLHYRGRLLGGIAHQPLLRRRLAVEPAEQLLKALGAGHLRPLLLRERFVGFVGGQHRLVVLRRQCLHRRQRVDQRLHLPDRLGGRFRLDGRVLFRCRHHRDQYLRQRLHGQHGQAHHQRQQNAQYSLRHVISSRFS